MRNIPIVLLVIAVGTLGGCRQGDDDDDGNSAVCTGLTPEGEECVEQCDEAYDACVEGCAANVEDPILCESSCGDDLNQCENACYDQFHTTEPCDDTEEG